MTVESFQDQMQCIGLFILIDAWWHDELGLYLEPLNKSPNSDGQ